MMQTTLSRRIHRVRHDLLRRELTVSRIEAISPGFISVTLTGASLDSFDTLSFDDHVKLMIESGVFGLQRRDYTPRRFNRESRELTLEFALHGSGPASEWAQSARVGQPLTVGGPRGSMVIPTDYHWHLLVGDATALPAIHRRLEELPADAHAIAVVKVNDRADRRSISSQARLDLRWVEDDQELLRTLRALNLPAGEGFAWAAGEAALMRDVRDIVLNEHRVPPGNARVSAYWKRGAVSYHDSL